jgi:hypothetical protein
VRAGAVSGRGWPQPELHFAVIGFNHIIHVLIEDMKVGGQQLIEHPEVGRCPIGGHLGRARAVLESLGKERASGLKIPVSVRRRR